MSGSGNVLAGAVPRLDILLPDDNPLRKPPSLAEGWSANTNLLQDWIEQRRQEGIAEGSVNPETGWPTAKGIRESGMTAAMGLGVSDLKRVPYASKVTGLDLLAPSDRISTRVPSGSASLKTGVDPHATPNLIVDYDTALQAPETLQKNADLIRSYPGVPTAGLRNAESISERFIEHVKDNVLHIHDQMDPEIRDRASQWYDGANAIARRLAGNQHPTTNTAGTLAALSPQKDWYQNVDLARRVIDTTQNHGDVVTTPEMLAWGQSKAQALADKGMVRQAQDTAQAYADLTGKRFNDLTGPERAYWLRAHDEVTRGRSYPIVTPEGEFAETMRTKGGDPQRVTWGSMAEIGNAIDALHAPDLPTISRAMGVGHKVRNFYNNIIAPNAPFGDVTVDTHAIGAGLLRPLGGSTAEAQSGLGISGYGDNGALGLKGLYPLYAEAYRRAAAARGILPRQMQSITWEGVRGLFSPEQRRDANFVGSIKRIWTDAGKRGGGADAARQAIFDAAGGINPPSWHGRNPSANAGR